MLGRVREKMVKQIEMMKTSFFTNIIDTSIRERCFIIVDEGANLCPTQRLPKNQRDVLFLCQEMLSEIARIGGGLGFRLIFCT